LLSISERRERGDAGEYRELYLSSLAVPEFIDPVFRNTSPKRSFLVMQNERFGLVFVKTGSIVSDNGDGVYGVLLVSLGHDSRVQNSSTLTAATMYINSNSVQNKRLR
jgi:hypothetical protein